MSQNALVVFYSRTGTTRRLAEHIAVPLDADLEELTDLKDRSGAIGYAGGIKDAALKRGTDLEPPRNDPADYDLVVLGTPVWANTMACAMRTYIGALAERLPRIALFCTMRASGADRALRHMAELAGREAEATLALRMKLVLKGECADEIGAFIETLRD